MFSLFLMVFIFPRLPLLYFYINYVRNFEAIDIFMRLLWGGTRDLLKTTLWQRVSTSCEAAIPLTAASHSSPPFPSLLPASNYCEISAAISSALNLLRDIKETGNNCERATDKLKCFVEAAYLGSHGVCFIYSHLSRVCTRSVYKSLGLSRDSKIAHMLELCLPRFAFVFLV